MRDHDKALQKGLQRWKGKRLRAIEKDMLKITQAYRAAQDGLGIAHRNPGEVRPDIIEYLWEELNRSATELERLEREHQKLMEMDLPHLIVTFQRSERKKTWPWEQEKWDLLTF